MKYDTVIFDLDGTLLNSLADLTEAVNYAMTQLSHPTRTIEEVHDFVGNGIRRTLQLSLSSAPTEEQLDTAVQLFRAYYTNNMTVYTKPYDGITELLQTLSARGVKIGIASNKADFAVQQLKEYFFGGLDIIAVGESPTMPRKPAADMVHFICSQAHAKSVLYVGDSDTDVATANNAGVDQISVLWGYRSRQQLEAAGAKTFVQTPLDILPIVCE